MKELKSNIIQTHYPITRYKPKKQWAKAQARPEKRQVIENECTEEAYHRVIALVKSLMKQGEVYYERDHKTDISEGLYGMHSFVNSTFKWSLYCELSNNYIIDYAIGDCPYKAEIINALKSYPLDRTAIEKQPQSNYHIYYLSVLHFQSLEHIYTL